MKKFQKFRAFLALPVLAGFLLGLTPALAEDDSNNLKVYYSESIGAGQKVFHITACSKTRAYAPLECSKVLKERNPDYVERYQKQCEYKNKKNEVIIREGRLIQGCLSGTENYVSPGVPYRHVYPKVFNDTDGKCPESDGDQGYLYVPQWVVIKRAEEGQRGVKDLNESDVLGTIAWDASNPGGVPPEVVKQIYSGGNDLVQVHEFYRTNFCATWDKIDDESTGGAIDPETEKQRQLARKKNPFSELIAEGLIEGGCNNSNADSSRPEGVTQSTPFDGDVPVVSCTKQERIVSKTGVGLLANYVHAIYVWASGIVGIVAVLVMVVSGVEISMAGGDSAKLDAAKNRILQSIAGLAILFLASLILYAINPNFFTPS